MNPVPMIVILIVCLAMAFILADKKTKRIYDDFSKKIDKEQVKDTLLEEKQEDIVEDEELKKELFRTPYDRTYRDGSETYINEEDRRFK